MTTPDITIALDWAANPNHSGLLVALRRGYFTEAGVNVRILPAEIDRSPTEVVMAGEADLAFAYEGTVLERALAGDPIIAVAAIAPRHNSSLVALRSSGVTRPADFQDKRYASFGHPALERAVIEQMMRADGVMAPEFDLRAVRFADVTGLIRGDYDFLWVYDGIEGCEAAAAGVDLVSLSPVDYGVPNYYAPVIFAHTDLLANDAKRDAAQRCIAALAHGYLLALSDPDATLADIHAVAPTLGGWLFTDDAATRASLRYQQLHYAPLPGAAWGAQTLERWTEFPRFLWRAGALGEIPEPAYATLFTNELLR